MSLIEIGTGTVLPSQPLYYDVPPRESVTITLLTQCRGRGQGNPLARVLLRDATRYPAGFCHEIPGGSPLNE